MTVYLIQRVSDGMYVGVPNKSYTKNQWHAWFFKTPEEAQIKASKEEQIVELRLS